VWIIAFHSRVGMGMKGERGVKGWYTVKKVKEGVGYIVG
jgi:hypothetical protein